MILLIVVLLVALAIAGGLVIHPLLWLVLLVALLILVAGRGSYL